MKASRGLFVSCLMVFYCAQTLAAIQAFTTCYDVWAETKKVYSNMWCPIIFNQRSVKLENMNVQTYLDKLDHLIAYYQTLMPLSRDAAAYAKNAICFLWSLYLVVYH